jgi:hypothetical protein
MKRLTMTVLLGATVGCLLIQADNEWFWDPAWPDEYKRTTASLVAGAVTATLFYNGEFQNELMFRLLDEVDDHEGHRWVERHEEFTAPLRLNHDARTFSDFVSFFIALLDTYDWSERWIDKEHGFRLSTEPRHVAEQVVLEALLQWVQQKPAASGR